MSQIEIETLENLVELINEQQNEFIIHVEFGE